MNGSGFIRKKKKKKKIEPKNAEKLNNFISPLTFSS